MLGFVRTAPLWAAHSLLRVLAWFSLVQVALELCGRGAFSAAVWVGLPGVPAWLAVPWLCGFSAAVLLGPRAGRRGRGLAKLWLGSAVVAVAVDVVRYYAWLGVGFTTWLPVPFSALVLLATVAVALSPVTTGERRSALVWRLAADAGTALTALLLLCIAVGATDYRRPADAIVVFGAGVRGDGEPTVSLCDRTRAACDLWRAGLAPVLVFSGGWGEGVPLSEPVAMRRIALEQGVPRDAILLDEAGVNTLATVCNARRLAAAHHWRSLLMVSHDYHLARIRLFCHRARLRAVTVPAADHLSLYRKIWPRLRELAALTVYYGAGYHHLGFQ